MSKNEFEMRHLKTIAKLYPTMAAATTEIVNLQAILNLPKGTRALPYRYTW